MQYTKTLNDRKQTVYTDENGRTFFAVKQGRGAAIHLSAFDVRDGKVYRGNTTDCRLAYNARTSGTYVPSWSQPVEITCRKCRERRGMDS